MPRAALRGQNKEGSMKKVASILVVLMVFLMVSELSAFESELLSIHGRIFEESKLIKAVLSPSNEVLLVSSMYGYCVIAMTQLDAYFLMIGLFEELDEDEKTKKAINYLDEWLDIIRKASDANIGHLEAVSFSVDGRTAVRIASLKAVFGELNNLIAKEKTKLNVLLRVKELDDKISP